MGVYKISMSDQILTSLLSRSYTSLLVLLKPANGPNVIVITLLSAGAYEAIAANV